MIRDKAGRAPASRVEVVKDCKIKSVGQTQPKPVAALETLMQLLVMVFLYVPAYPTPLEVK